MKRIIFTTIGLIWSALVFAQLEHSQETNDAEGGLIIRNSNNQSVRLWVDSNNTRHLGRGNQSVIAIDTDKLVGIGTQTPSSGILHIYRNMTTGGIGSVNTANAGLRIQDSGSSLYIDGNTLYTSGNMVLGTLSSATFTVGTNNSERMRINANGNIGFGTPSPSNGLVHIYKNATIGGIESANTSNSGLRIQDSGHNLYIDGNSLFTSGNMFLSTMNSTFFSIGTNNFERLRIDANGNVGIGTTNIGDWQLAVGGKIRAEEIKVETGWADFVFEKDYNLRTLEEVENFISENKHLPEIPSEAEVAENGINLGEMNAKLLQKIEELTLYLIEQNKELKAQKAQNLTQQELIEKLQKEVTNLKNE